MPKNFKIFLYIGAFLVGLLIFYVIVKDLTSSPAGQTPNPSQITQNQPDYTLTPDEEVKVKEFVKNFVTLYNTYSYGDYTNLTALGDYQTPEMQQKTINLVQSLQASAPQGYSVSTTPDMGTFKYSYALGQTMTASLQAVVMETKNQGTDQPLNPRSPEGGLSYKAQVSLSLTASGNNWLVNDISISKQ